MSEQEPMRAAAETVVMDTEPVVAPAEWERLPGGVTRTIKVDRYALGYQDAKPFVVTVGDGDPSGYAGIRIEGPCELIHSISAEECGSAHIETSAPIDVRIK